MKELEKRVRTCRLLEKMERSREYSSTLKLKNKSIYKEVLINETKAQI